MTSTQSSYRPLVFAIGDVVMLKSGGPRMTVSAVDAENVQAAWFTDAGQIQASAFPIACLRMIGDNT